MQEASTSEVCLGDIDGNTLEHLVSYMYGKLQSLDDCHGANSCHCSLQLTSTR